MKVVKTDREIEDLRAWCYEAQEQGPHYPGMSYEDGITTVLDWLDGASDENPAQ